MKRPSDMFDPAAHTTGSIISQIRKDRRDEAIRAAIANGTFEAIIDLKKAEAPEQI